MLRHCVLCLSLALLPPSLAAADLDERVAVEPDGVLRVELDRGDVEIRSHARDEIRIEARAKGVGASSIHFAFETDDDGAELTAGAEDWLAWLSAGPTVTVRAWVPSSYGVEVHTGGGDVSAEGVGGEVVARTRGGSVRVRDLEGDADLENDGGPIQARAVRGDVSAVTAGGRIEAVDIGGDVSAVTSGDRIHLARVGGDAEAHASGGPIWIEGIAGEVEAHTSGGPVLTRFTRAPAGSLETSGGAIEVAFPAQAGADLDALSRGGEVHCEHRVAALPSDDAGELRGTINGGGSTLRLRASGGPIHVRTF